MNQSIKIKLILISLFIFIPATIFGQQLTVVTENWRPYNYQDPVTKEIKGVSTAILKQVLNHTKIPYMIKMQPWNRSYHNALNEKNVLIYTIIRTPQREKLFKWVRPLGQGGFSSLYKLRSNKELRLKTLQEAKEFNGYILTNVNSMDHIWLEANGFKNLDVSHKVDSCIKKLFVGRAPLIIFNNSNIDEEFANAGFDANDVEIVLSLFQTPPYMALSLSTDNEILIKIQTSYDELLAQGKILLID